MSKKARFRGPFDKQHGQRTQAPFISASHYLYHIQWSPPIQLSWKKSLLWTWKILTLPVNTLVAYEKYAVLNRDNLTIPIQMQLSQKQKIFSQFFAAFLKSRLILNILKKTMSLTAFVFPKLRTLKTWLDKCLKIPVLEELLTSNMEKVPKDCSNLHHITFIIFIDHCQVNWVGKSGSYCHEKSSDSLLPHWLPMKSILFVIETI